MELSLSPSFQVKAASGSTVTGDLNGL